MLFEDHYFSLMNMTIHAINVDHKVRMNALQLADFASLNQMEKKALIDQLKNEKSQKKSSISEHLRK